MRHTWHGSILKLRAARRRAESRSQVNEDGPPDKKTLTGGQIALQEATKVLQGAPKLARNAWHTRCTWAAVAERWERAASAKRARIRLLQLVGALAVICASFGRVDVALAQTTLMTAP